MAVVPDSHRLPSSLNTLSEPDNESICLLIYFFLSNVRISYAVNFVNMTFPVYAVPYKKPEYTDINEP